MNRLMMEYSAESYTTVLKDKWKQYHRMKFDLGVNLSPEEQELFDKLADLKDKHSKMTNKKYYHFITIRPAEDIDRDLFKERLDAYIDKNNLIDEFAYVFEVTSKKIWTKSKRTEFGGFHCHLLIKNNKYEKNKIIRDIEKSLNRSGKNYHELITGRNMIDVDHRIYSHFQRTIEYMEGKKKDPEKKMAINATIDYRKEFPNSSRAYGYQLDLLDTHAK